jgi:hypothetical protein
LHNHQDNRPPSSGDLYTFIDLAIANSEYETRYIVTTNGTVYALVTTDIHAATLFNTRFPRVPSGNFEQSFPFELVDVFNQIRDLGRASEEMTMAFIIEKNNIGIALLYQDSNGNFKILNTDEEKDSDGLNIYVATNCQKKVI